MTIGYVVVRFTSKGHLGSRLMAALADQEQFNHCMMFDRGRVHEAVCWHGVRQVAPEVAMQGVKTYQDMVMLVPDIEAMRAFLQSVDGAWYDWVGAAGVPFHRDSAWQNPNKWWCRELLIAALIAGGIPREAFGMTKYGAPKDLYLYPAPKSPVVTVQ